MRLSASDELPLSPRVAPLTAAIDPLETVRQTLMTHMWPTMRRKPAARSTAGPEARLLPSSSPSGARPEPQRARTMEYALFPVTFDSGTPARPVGPASDFPMAEGYEAVAQEPGLGGEDDEEDEEGDGEFGDFAGPGDEEYARLDEWLDGEEEEMPVVHTRAGEASVERAEGGEQEDSASPGAGTGSGTGASAAGAGTTENEVEKEAPNGRAEATPATEAATESAGFDDDFGPTPTAPPEDADVPSANDDRLPLDPTPILLHLQNVRAELADVDDEDERRVRAGAEVARLMRSLGLGGDDLGLDELEFDEMGMP